MSETKNELYLQLKDIIKIDSPSNEKLHEQTFVVQYIDNSKIKLLNIESFDETVLLLNNKIIEDKSIEKIYLISRDENTSYALQNKFIINTWINIHFSGNLPVNESGVTGEIINLEEDMIEVKLYPSEEIIYIDFAYKGIPENLNIEKIEITEKPDSLRKTEEKELQEEKEKEISEKPSIIDNNGLVSDGELLISEQQQPNDDIHQQLVDDLLEANEIEIGDDLQEVEQVVEKDENEQRYGINIQKNDLLDELLSEIPTSNRTSLVMNNIHKMIERYTQLRNKFSTFDDLGNAYMPKIKTAIHKPLIANLKNMKQSLFWIRPVVKNLKYVYDIQNAEYTDDLINKDFDDSFQEYEKILEDLKQNTKDNIQNKYDNYNYRLHELCKPYEDTNEDETLLYSLKTQSNIDCIVDNMDDFYSSAIHKEDKINRKRYLIQRYITDNKDIYKDNLQLKSLVVLPFEYYFYSKINLPGTNILLKSSLETKQYYNFDILNNKHKLQSILVNENNEKDIMTNFFNNIIELNHDSFDDINKYETYLQKIIPKTKIIFDKLKKFITGKLSVYNVLSYLEPFLIYDDDLTYMQYKEIADFIKEKNSLFIQRYIKSEEYFKKINDSKDNISNEILKNDVFFNLLLNENHPIETDKNLHEIIKSVYQITEDNMQITSSEFLKYLHNYDSLQLYNICVTLASIHLLDSVDINKEIEDKSKLYTEEVNKEKTNNSCRQFFLSKKYIELDELEDDNNKEIFFDKKYDLDERKVEEGNYAVLKEEDKPEIYYKRINNKWELDSNIKGVESEQAIFCNIQDKCFQVRRDCNDLSLSESELKQKTIQHILDEFDSKYEISIQEKTKYLVTQLNYLTDIARKQQELSRDKLYKNNKQQFDLGININEDELNEMKSPIIPIRDRVLAETDFIKKQYNIIKFVKKYTRDPVSDESPYWLYCKESNFKLLPSFHYSLAKVFVENKDYLYELNKICNERGKLSDDGSAYVDEYSGDPIKYREFNDDEGYDEKGFKIVSKEIMEKEVTINIDDTTKIYEDEESKTIINIIVSMSNFLSIKLHHQYEFIVRNVLSLHEKKLPSKSVYDEQAKKLEAKGKKIQSYQDLKNFSLLINTLAFIHVAIQTSIPPIKTKKSHPGKCIKSFDGFPLELSGTYDGLKYIACVANSIKKKIEPWNTIQKVKEDILLGKLKIIIEKDIITNPVIKELFDIKNNYILTRGLDDIPDELNVNKWHTFLPPLIKTKITHLQPITSSVIDSLLSDIKKGSPEQHNKINVLKSKMMYYSHAIISEIDKIVSDPKNMVSVRTIDESFNFNYCCIQTNTQPVLDYFIEQSKLIKAYNNYITEYNNIVIDSVEIPQAPIFLHDNTTKLKYPIITDEYEEETIYKTFIKYCNFNDIKPIPRIFQHVCLSKPSSYNKNESLNANIKAMKSEGKIYTSETLKELLKAIGSNNVTNNYVENVFSEITKIRSFLTNISNDPILDEKFNNIMLDGLDTFELSDNNISSIKSTNDEIFEKNEILKDEIIDFLTKNSKDDIKNIVKFIKKYDDWIEISYKTNITNSIDDTSYRSIDFTKNINFLLTKTIPNMIINNQDLHENVPKHWNLSDNDNNKVRDSISEYFNYFSRYYHSKITDLLPKIEQKCINTFLLQSMLPCKSDILLNDNKSIRSILNSETCKLIHEYCFLSVIKQYILLSDEDYIEKTRDTFIEDFVNNNENIDEILLGNKISLQEEICSLLITALNMFISYKDMLNVSYEDIMNTVNKAKEKEKRDFTDIKLKQLSDEARKVNFKKKLLQLDEWNLGNQKGLTTYVKDWKDTGEAPNFMDVNIYDNSDTVDNSNLERELHNIENDVDIYQQEEERENYSMAHLAEDDDFGENDGDEGF